MPKWDDETWSDEGPLRHVRTPFSCNFDQEWPPGTNLSDIFSELTRKLQDYFEISKTVLVIKEETSSHFLAVATFSENKTRKNLSLRLPGHSSLFEKAAEMGLVYTESFCELFSGSAMERNLLLDEESRAYALVPLKHDGKVVGVLGLSSDQPDAFLMFENGCLDRIAAGLAARIVAETTGSPCE
ncbi:MAG: GAF domain-containing protein [candidate division Zixibacteria bacterium]